MGNKLIKNIFLDLISFNSPQAKVFNFSSIFLIAAFLPTNKLSYLPIFSIYEKFFDLTLYSSGMTRGMSRLFHGDFNGARDFNILSPIVAAVMLVLIIINVKRSIDYYKENKKIYKYF